MHSAPIYTGLRRRLAVLVAVLLATATVQLSRFNQSGAAAPSATTTPLSATTVEPTPPAVTTTTRPRLRPAPPPSPSSTTTITTTSSLRPPPALRPPVPGTYSYDVAAGGEQLTQTLVVVADPAGGGRQTFTQESVGHRQQQRVVWSKTGMAIAESVFGDGSRCGWTPAFSTLVTPLVTGASWRAEAACTMTGIVVREMEESRVTGRARTAVGGESVEVLVIQRRTTVTETAGAAVRTSEAISSELLAPALGLVVYQTSRTSTVDAAGRERTIDTVSALRSSRPT